MHNACGLPEETLLGNLCVQAQSSTKALGAKNEPVFKSEFSTLLSLAFSTTNAGLSTTKNRLSNLLSNHLYSLSTGPTTNNTTYKKEFNINTGASI